MNDHSQALMRAVMGPVILITVGVLFTLDRFSGIRFDQTWPVLLIVIGLLKLLGGRKPGRAGRSDPYVQPPPPASGAAR